MDLTSLIARARQRGRMFEAGIDNAPSKATKAARPSGPADPADIADYCATNGCPGMAADLIREKATMAEVEARVGAVGTIRALAVDAAKVNPEFHARAREIADSAIAAGRAVEAVRAEMLEAVFDEQSPEVTGAIAADTPDGETASTGWDRAVAKVNAARRDAEARDR